MPVNTGSFHCLSWDLKREKEVEPEWGKFCERWYQLDNAAYLLTDAFHETLKKGVLDGCEIYLSCPSASNESDWNFVQKGSISPAVFVHTLANVRLSSALQISESKNPFLCFLHAGPKGLAKSLREALFQVRQSLAPVLLAHFPHSEYEARTVKLFMLYPEEGSESPFRIRASSGSWHFEGKTEALPSEEELGPESFENAFVCEFSMERHHP